MKRATVVAFALAATAASGSLASAADLCGEVQKKEQPRAESTHPSAELAYGVWERVYGAFYAVTGRQTEIVVLGEAARLANSQPFPPNAFICPAEPGKTPVIYATWPLVQLVKSQRIYDVDFLAMVLGHELGHRVNDFDWEGNVTTKPGAKNVEDKADARGAFFAAVAGYSTRRLACDDALDLFLNVEANVSEEARKGRKLALAEVLKAFDVYESLYEASTSLVFWDAFKAKSLMRWVNSHLERHIQPIPEFKVLAALTILIDSADKACWTEKTFVPDAPASQLRCTPVYPTHTAFWDDAYAYASETRQCGNAIDKEILTGAVKLLNEALDEGADELVVRNGLACSYGYLAKIDQARAELAKAKAKLKPKTPDSVRAALDGNAAFIDWIDWMMASKVPAPSSTPAERAEWAKKLMADAGKFAAHAGIRAWTQRLAAYPTKVAPEPKRTIQCKAEVPKSSPGEGWSMLPAMPRRARSGGCPCGWSELHFLENEEDNLRDDGVRTCVPAGWGIGQRYIEINLPTAQVKETQLLMLDALSGSVANLRAWEKSCKVLDDRGLGTDGQRVFAGVCPELGAAEVVITADDCRVTRAVIHHQGP